MKATESRFARLAKAGRRDLTHRLAAVLCFASASSAAAQSVGDDDYLKMITDEVEQVSIESGSSSGYLPIELQPAAFEKRLQRDFPTVYVLYRSLSQGNRERVFQYYKSNNAVKPLQNYIVGLLADS